jgi:hypothetical protein
MAGFFGKTHPFTGASKGVTPEQRAEAAKAAQEKIDNDRQTLIAYKKFFGSSEGKLVLMDLANHCGLLEDGITTDARVDAFKLGQVSVVKRILKYNNTDLGLFEKLLRGEL